jgi:hypothetical protein
MKVKLETKKTELKTKFLYMYSYGYVQFELQVWPHCVLGGTDLSVVIEKSVLFPPTAMERGLPKPILQTDGVWRTSTGHLSRTHYVFINAIAVSAICTSVKGNSGIYAFS